jgi:hypothetical protein
MKAIDLFCGLGGWADGFLAEGYEVVGFDIEAHDYGTGGYPGTLILRDVRSIHGSEFKDAAVIVASPPCQEPSYRAMCWKTARALHPKTVGISEPEWWAIPEKASKNQRGMTSEELSKWRQYQLDYPLPPPDLFIELFNACFRIQREASEAAGHYIPLIVENVRGAQKWVGRARANFGSFYLWGDVGMVGARVVPVVEGVLLGTGIAAMKTAKVPGFRFDGESHGSFQSAAVAKMEGYKTAGMNWSNRELHGQDFTRIAGKQAEGVKLGASPGKRWEDRPPNTAAHREGVKFSQSGAAWFDGKPRDKMLGNQGPAAFGSRSNSRKYASALIAKIPFALSNYIARHFKEASL